MSRYSLSHLSDPSLTRNLTAVIVHDRGSTADVLAHIAEFDSRRLFALAAHPSMFSHCVHVLRLSEDAASKRIQAARAARRFPMIFEALADGRLHLRGICLLAPHLTPENADNLLAAAAGQTKAAIAELLAQRFPHSETMGLVQALPTSAPRGDAQPAPAQVEPAGPTCVGSQHAPGHVEPRSKVAPVAAERFLLQVTVGRSTQDKLQYVQAMLGHQIPSGDLAQMLDRALDALIEKLEKQKFAATSRPPAPGLLGRPAAHPGGGQARGVEARRRAMQFRERGRPALPGAQPPRVRPCRPGGARGRGHGGERSPSLPPAQRVRRRAHLRRRLHEREARGAPAPGGASAPGARHGRRRRRGARRSRRGRGPPK